jgi:hypothetical protein
MADLAAIGEDLLAVEDGGGFHRIAGKGAEGLGGGFRDEDAEVLLPVLLDPGRESESPETLGKADVGGL